MSQKIKLEIETLSYGKNIKRNPPGAVESDATYDIKEVSPGLQGKSEYYPHNLTPIELAPHHIDPEFKDRGALVLRSVPDGMLLTRLKFRPDGGEGNTTSRSFMLARTILVPGWRIGRDIQSEFLLKFCEDEKLRAKPFNVRTPPTGFKIPIEIEKWTQDDFNTHITSIYDNYKDNIKGCSDSMKRKSTDFCGFGMVLPVPASPMEPPVDAAFFAEKVVLMSMQIAAGFKQRGGWEFNLSISIGLAPSAGTSDLYFSSQISPETTLNPGDLRQEEIPEPIFGQSQEDNETDSSSTYQDKGNHSPVEIPKDSLGRLIGKEPINFSREGAAA